MLLPIISYFIYLKPDTRWEPGWCQDYTHILSTPTPSYWGWRLGEQYPTENVFDRDGSRLAVEIILPNIPHTYKYLCWIDSNADCDHIITMAATPGKEEGLFCRGCGNWFAFAVPNRPSGNLVCWSCRQGFVPEEW
jgi:hypothetical protein